MKMVLRILAVGLLVFLHVGLVSGRVTEGLLVFYDFASEEGTEVKDRSGVGDALDLEISDLKGVLRRQLR